MFQTKLTQQEKDAWLVELRDPNNHQVTGKYFSDILLSAGRKTISEAHCMCAMGCLIKASCKLEDYVYERPTDIVDKTYTFDADNNTVFSWRDIADMNDNKKMSFIEIADWVEKNVLVEA